MTTIAARATALLLVLGVLLAGPALESGEARPKPEPRFAKPRAATFDEAMETERARQGLVGLAVAVIEGGTLAHVGTYGLADRDAKRKVDERTLFRWASVAKPVTAVAALQLVQGGSMKLDAPAGTYWKGLPKETLAKVPVEALLRQQGGVGHYAQMGRWKTRLERHYAHRDKKPWDAKASVLVMQEPKLLAGPYERYHYTTFGYNLLGALVEGAGRAPFERQVAERIAKPLRMTTFEPDYEFEKRPHRTRGYRKKDGAVVPSEPGDVSWKLPGGGFHSTVGDMGRFGVGLLGTDLLDEKARTAMFTLRQPKEGKTSYAMGIGAKWRDGRVVRLSHSGAQARTRTLLILYPPEGRGVAVMTNSEWGKTMDVFRAAHKALGW